MIVAKCAMQGRNLKLVSNLWTEMAYIMHCSPMTDKMINFLSSFCESISPVIVNIEHVSFVKKTPLIEIFQISRSIVSDIHVEAITQIRTNLKSEQCKNIIFCKLNSIICV